MPSFQGQLTEPYPIRPESTGYGTSTAGTIGGALSGLADILDVWLKASAEDKKKKTLEALEGKLVDVSTEFGNQPGTPALIGEARDPNVEASQADPYFQRADIVINRARQAANQGRITREEFLLRAQTAVQEAVTASPRFAQEIRERAQQLLGLNPTAALAALEMNEQAATEATERTIRDTAIATAANAGNVWYTVNGELDLAHMEQSGRLLQRINADLATQKQQLEIVTAQENIRRLREGTGELTLAEQQNTEERTFLGLANQHFETFAGSALSRIPQLLDQYAELNNEEASNNLLQEVNTLELSFNTWLNESIRNAQLDSTVTTNVRKYYTEQFNVLRTFAGGGLDNLALSQRQLDTLTNEAKIDLTRAAPLLARMQMLFGTGAIQPIIDTILAESTRFRTTVVREAEGSAFLAPETEDHIRNLEAIMSGEIELTSLRTSEEQRVAIASLITQQERLVSRPNDLTDLELRNFGRGSTQLIATALQSTDATELRNAASYVSSPSFLRAFERYKSDPNNAENTAVLATGIFQLNMATVQSNLNIINSGQSIRVPGLQGTMRGALTDVVLRPVYNPETGLVEIDARVATSGRIPLAPASAEGVFDWERLKNRYIPRELQTQVNQINQSLTAVVTVKDNITDLERNLSPEQLKQLIVTSTGSIGFKPRTTPIEMPQEAEQIVAPSIPDNIILDAIKQVESRGDPNAVSRRGALGTMQVMPATAADPGLGVVPAKDNSPAELERVGKEVFIAYQNKYNGDTTLALIAYNWGPTNTDRWLAAGGDFEDLPQETRNYISKVYAEQSRLARGQTIQ